MDTNHWQQIYGLSMKVLGNHHDAEDCAQNTYLKALEKEHQLKDKSKEKSWLCMIAFNMARQYLREAKTERTRRENFSHVCKKSEFTDPSISLDARKILARINPQNAKAISSFCKGFTYAELAPRHGLTRVGMTQRGRRALLEARARFLH